MKKLTFCLLCSSVILGLHTGNLHAQEAWQRDKTTQVVEYPEMYFLNDTQTDIISLYLMDRNLGASTNDASKTGSMGDYYQWGRDADGHQKIGSGSFNLVSDNGNLPVAYSEYASNRAKYAGKYFIRPDETTTTYPADWSDNAGSVVPYSNHNKLWVGLNGENNPCPAGYRIPTNEEWRAILQFPSDNITPDLVDFDQSGIYGADADGTIKGKYQKVAGGVWTIMNNIVLKNKKTATPEDESVVPYLEIDFNGNKYTFPMAGRRKIDPGYNTTLYQRNLGYYWTSSFYEQSEPAYLGALRVYIHHNSGLGINARTWPLYGHSVRCVRKAGEVATAVNEIQQDGISFSYKSGLITVTGAPEGSVLNVFDVQGRQIVADKSANSPIEVGYKGLAIIRLTRGNVDKSVKLMLR